MLKSRISIVVVTLAAIGGLSACDNGDSVVSVNFSFDSTASTDKTAVSKVHISLDASGGHTETDYPVTHNDKGDITSLTFKRFTVNGWSGTVNVKADAYDDGGNLLVSAEKKEDIVDHGAVAAFVVFKHEAPSGDSSGSGGASGSGSGGASGSGSGGSGSGGAG